MMEKKLENLRWKPMWVSHLGCIKGCLDYLGLDVSDAWLFGATGHAFIINMHEVVCPSGPTAWNTEMLFKLGRNAGYVASGVFSRKSARDFAEKQKLAWEMTRRAIDEGVPCYGWELDMPEYYVVYGYDGSGYYFSGPGCDAGKGPKPWMELSCTEIGSLEMYSVRRGKAADDATTVKEALEFALEHSKSPAKWIHPKYKAGPAGYDKWIQALETGKANKFGAAYNAAVWNECRQYAVKFLEEAKERIRGRYSPLFENAAENYKVVAQNLQRVSQLFPFPPKDEENKNADICKAAIEYLRKARSSEELGLKTLEDIVKAL